MMVDHLWQSSLFAALVWLATLALRSNDARVRYWLWAAASVKFLVPFSWLIDLGARFDWRTPAPVAAQPAVSFMMDEVLAAPVSLAPMSMSLANIAEPAGWPWLLIGVWVIGAAGVLLWWGRQWIPVRRALRGATPLALAPHAEADGLRVMSSSSTFEPGVVGLWRPVLLVPGGLIDRLTPAQLTALIAHERCHVRHHDNLVAAVHMLVEAIFWFHPLVWWIERRLIDERERACDEAVLQSGNEPADYAEGILAVCTFTVEAPLMCVTGITGADLRRRVETIMRGELGRPLALGARVALALALVALIGVPIAAGVMDGAPLVTVGQEPDKPVVFEVASVRQNRSGEIAANTSDMVPGGGFTATNAPLRLLITQAYGIRGNQLLGAPDWIATERFDINARLGHEPPEVSPYDISEARLALRSLLAERFKLVVHRETREMPMYALVMARADRKPGPKLTPSTTDCSRAGEKARMAAIQAGKPPTMCGSRFNTGRIRFGGYPISDFVKVFLFGGRSVVDRTGLTGNWDFELTFTPDDPQTAAQNPNAPPLDPDAPSLPTAFQEQLGLKLEPITGPMEVLVVDRVERLIEN